jgi:hypothetical protein
MAGHSGKNDGAGLKRKPGERPGPSAVRITDAGRLALAGRAAMFEKLDPRWKRLVGESKAMRIVNSVAVLDLVWTGPHQLADLVAFNGARDYGVYQIYGTHGVNGPDNA